MLYFLDLNLISKGTIMLIYKIIIKIFILLLVAFPTFGSAENTSIPDANFEQKLIDLGHDDVLDGNFNDGIMVYDSDDDVEDEDYANVNYED